MYVYHYDNVVVDDDRKLYARNARNPRSEGHIAWTQEEIDFTQEIDWKLA